MYDPIKLTRLLVFGAEEPSFIDYNDHIRPLGANPDTQYYAIWVHI
jgi:hypothetical protein